MRSYQLILEKLEAFISRYYRRQLIKGVFVFLFLGGLLFLFIGGLEYFLWMSTGMRRILLWIGLAAEGYLLVRYILRPLLLLFRLRKGLSHKEGSQIIGTHFPQVSDRLYNLLELAESPTKTELLLASIEQRSQDLEKVPFQRAIRMSEGLKYARFAIVPALIFVFIWLGGYGLEFLDSYKRVANYQLAYDPPAPFSFELMTPGLRQREDKPFVLKVRTPGEVQPEEVRLVLGGVPMIMEDAGAHFQFTFRPPLKNTRFQFQAGDITSRTYELEVIRVPAIDRFEMRFEYPGYLGMQDETVRGSGNATIPEGTGIRWKIQTIHADSLRYRDGDTVKRVAVMNQVAEIDKRVWRRTRYSISASNKEIPEYDRMDYEIEVIRDQYPEIKVRMERDSLNPNLAFFEGDLSDDHGISGLKLVVYPALDEESVQEIELPAPSSAFHSFYYTFPSGLELKEDTAYDLYFEVTDNDGNRGGKSKKSRVFELRKLGEDELERRQMEYNSKLLEGMGKSAKEQERLQKSLEEIQRSQIEKETLSYEDKQELKDFLKQQEQQERLMEKFSRELTERMDVPEGEQEDELLKERLERMEAEARKNAELMKEIQKILDQLDREALEERMEEVGKAQQGNQRSMQQLLELTKRYYVQEKSRQLSRELKKLSEKQEVFSEIRLSDKYNREQQKKLNDQFKEVRKDLERLEDDNKDLKKPLPWKRDIPKEESVEKDQRESLEEINEEEGAEQATDLDKNEEQEKVSKKQRNAARKLKELSEQLDQGASMGGAQSMAEDAEMLRQILDNLLVFSLEQEALFEKVQQQEEASVDRSEDIKKQRELKELFEHVDDSLFALSLRRVEISENINQQISDVYYNLDKGLESFGENSWFRGASFQQYVITATNELAAFLADLLDNMQESMMPGKGQGQGGDFQLPDIIQSQGELQQQMGNAQDKGSQKGQQEGQNQGAEGEQGNEGGEKQGKEGDKGESKEGAGGDSKDGRNGDKTGKGKGSTGENKSQGFSEEDYAEYFEIYKKQQQIRLQLEKQLEDMINESDRKLGEQIAREMELFEEEILRNGITERTADRLNRIQQQLMRLENATLRQGERKERESQSNTQTFDNPILTKPEVFKKDRMDIEYLNRQPLPLRRLYQEKVRRYFRSNDTIPLPDGV
ncbi:MAG: hypothetical protein P8X60_00795 [Robiginitalea sp.]